MQNAIWLASIFGPYLTILGLWMVLYTDNMNKVWSSIKSTAGLFYMTGAVSILLGLVVLSQYNEWGTGWAMLVTIFGWVMLIRGIAVLFVPQMILKMMNPAWMKALGIVPIAWGLLMCWFAFYM